jgi:tubulin beta
MKSLHMQRSQYGNKVDTKFWELIATEHGVGHDGSYSGTDDLQLSQIDVYFS